MTYTGDGFKIWILAGSGSLIGNLYCGVKVRGPHTLQCFECYCGISFGHRFALSFFKKSPSKILNVFVVIVIERCLHEENPGGLQPLYFSV